MLYSFYLPITFQTMYADKTEKEVIIFYTKQMNRIINENGGSFILSKNEKLQSVSHNNINVIILHILVKVSKEEDKKKQTYIDLKKTICNTKEDIHLLKKGIIFKYHFYDLNKTLDDIVAIKLSDCIWEKI